MTGAAMTTVEKEGYYDILRPKFGDDEAVRRQKAQARHEMAGQLKQAAARGVQKPDGQGASGIPQDAIADLLDDPSPEAIDEFEQVFGQGSAETVLNGAR